MSMKWIWRRISRSSKRVGICSYSRIKSPSSRVWVRKSLQIVRNWIQTFRGTSRRCTRRRAVLRARCGLLRQRVISKIRLIMFSGSRFRHMAMTIRVKVEQWITIKVISCRGLNSSNLKAITHQSQDRIQLRNWPASNRKRIYTRWSSLSRMIGVRVRCRAIIWIRTPKKRATSLNKWIKVGKWLKWNPKPSSKTNNILKIRTHLLSPPIPNKTPRWQSPKIDLAFTDLKSSLNLRKISESAAVTRLSGPKVRGKAVSTTRRSESWRPSTLLRARPSPWSVTGRPWTPMMCRFMWHRGMTQIYSTWTCLRMVMGCRRLRFRWRIEGAWDNPSWPIVENNLRLQLLMVMGST